MKKSSIISAITSLVLVAAISVGATIAYLTSTDEAGGSFNFGNVKFSVNETVLQDTLNATTFVPNASRTLEFKDLVTMDADSEPAYLRIKVSMENFDSNGLAQAFEKLDANSPWKLDLNNYGYSDPSVFYIIYDGGIGGIADIADFTTGVLPDINLSVDVRPQVTGNYSNTDMKMNVEAIQAEGFNGDRAAAFVKLDEAIASANP